MAYGPAAVLDECPFGEYAPFFRRQPLHVLRAMRNCPPIKSSILALKSTILSGGFQLTPAVAPSDDNKEDPDAVLALQILEECKRSTSSMDRPMEVWAWEMLDAMIERNKLSEITLGPVKGGPDDGLYAIRSLKVKPHWSYRYRVDLPMNVTAIDAWTVDEGWRQLDPKWFTWLSWDSENGDPRGHSILDAAFHAFNLLMKLWPEFYAGNQKFGSPSIFLTTGEQSKPMVQPRDSRGNEIPGAKPVTHEFALAMQGSKMKNGATIAAPYGSTAKVIESTRDGVGMNSAIAVLESQIIVCFLLQTRATREAQFGSKADSQSGTDVLTTFAQIMRQPLCEAARKPYFLVTEANHGPEIARRLTPHVNLGKIDPRNFAAIAQAIGLLYQSGYFTEPQLLWLDAYLGMPQRRPGDVRVGPQKDNAGEAQPLDTMDTQTRAAFLDGFMGEIKAHLTQKGMPQ